VAEAVAKAQAELKASRTRHEKFILTSTAELDERRKQIVSQEMDLRQREAMVEATAERTRQTEDILKTRFGLIEFANASGLVREFVDTAPERVDPHYGAA